MKTAKPTEDLNAWIAEHVMGWMNDVAGSGKFYDPNPNMTFHAPVDSHRWKPTTDPADAMAVLEKCAENCAYVTIMRDKSGGWFVDCENGYPVANAETLPLAICRFAKELYEL